MGLRSARVGRWMSWLETAGRAHRTRKSSRRRTERQEEEGDVGEEEEVEDAADADAADEVMEQEGQGNGKDGKRLASGEELQAMIHLVTFHLHIVLERGGGLGRASQKGPCWRATRKEGGLDGAGAGREGDDGRHCPGAEGGHGGCWVASLGEIALFTPTSVREVVETIWVGIAVATGGAATDTALDEDEAGSFYTNGADVGFPCA